MADFDIIETGFDSANETINFGSTHIENSNLYEISTISCLKSSEGGDNSQLVINSLIKNGRLFVTTNKSLKIFGGESLLSILFSASFTSIVVAICVSNNGEFITLYLKSGQVRVLYIGSKGDVACIFSDYILDDAENVQDFVDIFDEDITIHLASFLLIFSNSKVKRLYIDQSEINAYDVCNEDICTLDSTISLACYSYPILSATGSKSVILNVANKSIESDVSHNFKILCPLGCKILGLDKNGNLLKICTLTLIIFPINYDVRFDDIMLLNDGRKNEIVGVTQKNEQGDLFLKRLRTDFSDVYSLKIRYPVHFIQSQTLADDFLFLSKIYTETGISELRLQVVKETEPELRLIRLVRRQRFQEAEEFSKAYNLDPMIIKKAKAEHIVRKLECTSEDIDNLIVLMDEIGDEYYNLQCCTNIDCSSMSDIKRILDYGTNITLKKKSEDQDAKLLLKQVLSDQLFKFETYLSLSDSADVQSWSIFSTCDLIEEIKSFLRKYQIEEAIILYSRLDKKTIEASVTDKNIEAILNIIDSLPRNTYEPFLPTFIHITMMHKPSVLPIFVNWLHHKIIELEKSNQVDFPENALHFAQKILKLLKVEEKSTIIFNRQCILNKKCLDDLSSLMEGLKMIQNLKKNFGLIVTLFDSLKDPKELIDNLLNITMSPGDFDTFLKEFIYNFIMENHFDSDTIFSNKIKYLLQFEDNRISTIEVILKYICSLTTKLEAIKNILNKSQVPWCDVTRRIGQSALQYSHLITEEIQSILDDETIWIILRKYFINERRISGVFEYERIVKCIIRVNHPSMVDDIFQICKIPERKSQACHILIDHFIRIGDLEKVNSIFNTMTSSEIYECIKFIIIRAEVDLSSKRSNPNYYMSLGMLYFKFGECCEDKIEKEQYDTIFQILKSIYNLNEAVGKKFVAHDFVRHDEKIILRNVLLKEFAENFVDQSSFSSILGASQKLSTYLTLDKDDVLVRMCEIIGKFDIIVKAAEHLFETEANAKYLRLICVLFLKHMGNQAVRSETIADATFEITISSDVPLDVELADNQVYVNAFKLFPKIISKALSTAAPEELPFVLEIMEWIDISFYLTYKKSTILSMLFRDMYSGDQMVTNYSEYSSALTKYFHICVNYMGFVKIERGSPTFVDGETQLTMEEVSHQLSFLPVVIDNLSKYGLHLTAYHMLNTLKMSFLIPGDTEVIQLLDKLIQAKLLPQLIHFVVSNKYIDCDLLYNLLLESKGRYINLIERYLLSHKRDTRKLHDISVIVIQLQDFYNQTTHKFTLLNAVISCKWWTNMKTRPIIMPYDDFFKSTKDKRLMSLIESNFMDIDSIRDYCKDFSLDMEIYYKIYLKSYILNWKLDFEYQTKSDGHKSIVIKNDENSLHDRCQDIINVIEDKTSIFTLLEEILNSVNFYLYEVFICIYNILQNNAEVKNTHTEKLRVLLFLKSYCRCSEPSQREQEEWYTNFPKSQALDPLSEYRLPFNKLIFNSDIWSIVRPEINLKTYKCWFEVASVLLKYLIKDDICVYAIKQVVSSKLLGDTVTNSWILYPKLGDLFDEIDQCVQKISNLERATSVIYHLMNHTPNGIDKVNAAQLSYKYAKKYKDANPNSTDIEKAYIKVKHRYRSLSAKHILYKFNLADTKYLGLISNPSNLIETLYMDDRILKKAESVTLECPDINKAVDEIAEFFNLEILSIQYNLLNSWLSSSSANCDIDSTILLPNPIKSETKLIENDDNLKRAMYLCSSNSKHTFWQQYLLNIGINEELDQKMNDVTRKSVLFKANALKCFCAITDEETIGTLTKVSYSEILNFIEKLSILSELESSGVLLTVEALDQCNKKELLKRLSQSATTATVRVMARICITYCIDNTRCWEYLINKSMTFGMIDELKMYVDFLKDKYDRSFYLKAWQMIIDNSFQRLTSNVEDLDESLRDTFLMMQSCPVLFSLNFLKGMKICLNLNKYEYAAILLQLCPEEQRQEYCKDISECPTLLKDLAVLEKNGIWGVRNVKKWLAQQS